MQQNYPTDRQQVRLSVLVFVALGVLLWRGNDSVVVVRSRTILGLCCLLVLPGYRTTKALFSSESLDGLEYIALSFAFSIAVVPLVIFYANLLGFAITAWLVYVVALLVVLVGGCYTVWRQRHIDDSAVL